MDGAETVGKSNVLRFKKKNKASAPAREGGVAEMYDLGPHDRMTAEEALQVVLREKPANVVIVYTEPDVDDSGEDVERTVVRHSGNLTNADLNFIADKLKLRSLGLDV